MKQLPYFIIFLILLFSCEEKPLEPEKPVFVKIQTTMGDITVLLYDDTPLHRDNFIKLCQSKAYEGLLFHRIIADFVVQAGDPTSKERVPGKLYGEEYGGYTIPAEILSHHFNKRGALIDAKRPDNVNPERASSGMQFCIVQGKIQTEEELNAAEKRLNAIRKNWFYYKYANQLKKENPKLADDPAGIDIHASIMVADTLETLSPIIIPEEHRDVYKTIGGTPLLDGSFTVFGEVIEGLEIVEKMSQVKTDKTDRPEKDIFIKSTKVFQK